MGSSRAKSRRSVATPNRALRWVLAGAGMVAIVAAGLVTASVVSSHDQGAQGGPAGQCPNYDIDPNTGKLRDKGLVPCGTLAAQNGRLGLIRDSFKGR
jgi:hypothetical protein